ncbi:hypothetical protein PpBr36_00248 [Pyricularia pennisetigena]|uniref:hypothetical protein n=1 Tax=Pyricularia pennisetigena TaxID=1578925 RepID=UPI0011533B49|nr:hypothetical protein PpBr36_00248 [Pyricularia pennisetigena]TLS28503.1 hypothetical protein PpBr36_00248 [Pyricularia pennisetigena]
MATGVDAKLLKSTRFPPEFSQKVDMQKVNLQVMKKWIASRISEILGSEDDVVIELCYNLIESSRFPDIKGLQIQLTGFLDKETPGFCKELWNLCLSAQASPQGVPKELLEAKKRELMQEKIEAEKAAEERQKREAQSFRGRGDGRSDSYRGGGRGRGRGGGFGDRDMNDRRGGFTRGRDGSRSPPPRGGVGGDSYRAPRRDIYVPRGRRNSMGRRGDTKRRSPSVDSGSSRSRTRSASSASSDRSPSRSRSPPPRREQRGSRYRDSRKRLRSPRRPYRPRRRSSSVASVSRSRSPKRRRRASSRGREVGRLTRSPSSSSTSSRSRSRSRLRSRSRSRSRSPPGGKNGKTGRGSKRRGRSPTRSPSPASSRGSRRRRRHGSRSLSKHRRSRSPNRSHGRHRSTSRDRGKNRDRSNSRHRRHGSDRKRRQSPSISPPRDSRDKSADGSRTKDRPTPQLRTGEPESTTAASSPPKVRSPLQKDSVDNEANLLREKELKERILKMRSSKSGSSIA